MTEIHFRKYGPITLSRQPLIVGWVPTAPKLNLIAQGRAKELPGYWLYEMQFRFKNKLGRLCGKLFGLYYANKKVETRNERRGSNE